MFVGIAFFGLAWGRVFFAGFLFQCPMIPPYYQFGAKKKYTNLLAVYSIVEFSDLVGICVCESECDCQP